MSEQELSDGQRADLYLARAARLQSVVDDLRQEAARNLEAAEMAVKKGVSLERQLEEARKLVRVLGRSLTECSAPMKDSGGLIYNRRQLALLRLGESE